MEAEKEKKTATGRPSKYKREYAEQARKLCLLGYRNEDLADFFGVDITTIHRWKQANRPFRNAIKAGKALPDAEIAESLFNRGKGYSHPEEKIFMHEGQPVRVETVKHYPPDTAAAFIWLKNRQPELWRDKHEVEVSGSVSLEGALRSLSEDIIDVTPSPEQIESPDDE